MTIKELKRIFERIIEEFPTEYSEESQVCVRIKKENYPIESVSISSRNNIIQIKIDTD